MGMRRIPAGRPVTVSRLEVREEDRYELERTAGEVCGKALGDLTLNDLGVVLGTDLPKEQRDTFLGMREALTGDVRGGKDSFRTSAVPDAGEPTTTVYQHSMARLLQGETSAEQRVRKGMPNHLWGHDENLKGCIAFAKDYVSTVRLTPPVMAITGNVGHGKDQLVAGLVACLLAEGGQAITIDLAGKSDNDLLPLLEEQLELERLRSLAEENKVLLHFRNADKLLTDAPQFAEALCTRLLQSRKDEGPNACAFVPYVFDFDQMHKDPGEVLYRALGDIGVRVLSAKAALTHLEPETMWRYADVERVFLHDNPALANVELEFDPEAKELLSEMLCTPFEPLHELRPRLFEFIYTQIDTATSLDRRTGVVRVRLTEALHQNPKARDAMAAAAQAPGYKNLQELGEQAFRIAEVGARVPASLSNAREELIAAVAEVDRQLAIVVEDVRENVPLKDERSLELLQIFQASADEWGATATAIAYQMNRSARLGLMELVSPESHATWQHACAVLLEIFDDVTNEILLVLSAVANPTGTEASPADVLGGRLMDARNSIDALSDAIETLSNPVHGGV